MKTFKSLNESLRGDNRGRVKSSPVRKVHGIPFQIKAGKSGGFDAIVDGDILDNYDSEEEANKSALAFIKSLKSSLKN